DRGEGGRVWQGRVRDAGTPVSPNRPRSRSGSGHRREGDRRSGIDAGGLGTGGRTSQEAGCRTLVVSGAASRKPQAVVRLRSSRSGSPPGPWHSRLGTACGLRLGTLLPAGFL